MTSLIFGVKKQNKKANRIKTEKRLEVDRESKRKVNKISKS